jgi:hypothetical protein
MFIDILRRGFFLVVVMTTIVTGVMLVGSTLLANRAVSDNAPPDRLDQLRTKHRYWYCAFFVCVAVCFAAAAADFFLVRLPE